MSDPRRHRHARWLRRVRRLHLVQVFRKDPLFAWAFGLLLTVALLALLAIPRIWRTTPPDFAGSTVRVNWIDLLQARSLARGAHRAAAANDLETALAAWRGAILNNPGDPRWHRGLLEFLRDTPQPHPDLLGPAQTSIHWLLALTATNTPDAALAARVLERYGRPRLGLSLTRSLRRPGVPSPDLDEVLNRCAIAAGRAAELGPEWEDTARAWERDPLLRLYAAAGRAGSAEASLPSTATATASGILRTALPEPGERGLTAARLLWGIAATQNHLEDLEAAVARLDQAQAASATHHAALWHALERAGRPAEARQRASAFHRLPRDPEDAANLLHALRSLDLTDHALRLVHGRMTPYGAAPRVWREYFDGLAEQERWTELRQAMAEARPLTNRQNPLHAESLFAAYRIARAAGLTGETSRLARELAAAEVIDPAGAWPMVAALRDDGHTEAARTFWQRLEPALGSDLRYWSEAFAVARAAADLDALRIAVKALERLDPAGPRWESARAALLLIVDEDPAEALRLTFAALQRQPDSVPLRINHAFALTRNHRAPEAEALLRSLRPQRMPPEMAANLLLALTEALHALERWPEALATGRQVDRSFLLPPQTARLDRLLARAHDAAVLQPPTAGPAPPQPALP